MKKTLCAVISIFLLLALFTGCDFKQKEANAKEDKSPKKVVNTSSVEGNKGENPKTDTSTSSEEGTASKNPDEITDIPPGEGSMGGDDTAKINFESEFHSFVYSPTDSLTEVDHNSKATNANDFYYAGKQSMRIDGTLQKDKYSDAIEFGYRIDAGKMLNVRNLEIVGEKVSVRAFVPSGFSNRSIQFVLLDDAYQWAISTAVTLTPGQWHTVYFKLVEPNDKDNQKYAGKFHSLEAYDESGKKIGNAAYTSPNLKIGQITSFELRIIGGVVGDKGTVFIDSIDW